MSDVISLPLLSVPDLVVLPGMVVPVELDGDARPVIEAAQAGSDERLLLAPAPLRPLPDARRDRHRRAGRPTSRRRARRRAARR